MNKEQLEELVIERKDILKDDNSPLPLSNICQAIRNKTLFKYSRTSSIIYTQRDIYKVR